MIVTGDDATDGKPIFRVVLEDATISSFHSTAGRDVTERLASLTLTAAGVRIDTLRLKGGSTAAVPAALLQLAAGATGAALAATSAALAAPETRRT
jgi:hypothetical protein